jgi:HKD family nuclease
MALTTLVLQAWTDRKHERVLRDLIETPNLTKFYASVAFARLDGVNAVKRELSGLGQKSRFFVGVRNEITSRQALEALLAANVDLYAVDTAKRSVLFHPKAFMALTAVSARILVGSANLTHSGLFNNIEFGVLNEYDLRNEVERNQVETFRNTLDALISRYPRHLIKLDQAKIQELFDSGRLEDESVRVVFAPRSSVRRGNRDDLPPINTPFVPSPARSRSAVRRVAGQRTRSAVVAVRRSKDEYELVWQSKGLSERDLCIPTGPRTNATGSMLWKKGDIEGIDQRHFFRDDVFSGLPWRPDPTPSKRHLERVTAPFRIVVKGIDLGTFNLRMSHNTLTTTPSYMQNNGMTQIHWGEALRHIAKRDLLGRTMALYRHDTDAGAPEFLIEID